MRVIAKKQTQKQGGYGFFIIWFLFIGNLILRYGKNGLDRVEPSFRHSLVAGGVGVVDFVREKLGGDRAVRFQHVPVLINRGDLASPALEFRHQRVADAGVVVRDTLGECQ